MRTAKTAKIWFVNPQNKKIFWDWIDIDPTNMYYHTMVFECGPTQVVAELHDDGTVESVRYKPYGIDTKGLRWFEDEKEARNFLNKIVAESNANEHKSAAKVIAELCGNPSIEKEVNARLKADRRKKKRTRIIIEHGDERYEVKFARECTRDCAFAKHTPYGTCENNCSLPKWFEKIVQKFPEAHLKRINKD